MHWGILKGDAGYHHQSLQSSDRTGPRLRMDGRSLSSQIQHPLARMTCMVSSISQHPSEPSERKLGLGHIPSPRYTYSRFCLGKVHLALFPSLAIRSILILNRLLPHIQFWAHAITN